MFHEFDQDHNGTISLQEAQDMLNKLQIPPEEVASLMAIYDENEDGELQYEEFVSFLLHC